jgi:hypothetical protein
MTTFDYILATADRDQLDYLSLLQQAIDESIYQDSRCLPDDRFYSNEEYAAIIEFCHVLGEAFSKRYTVIGPYWDTPDPQPWETAPYNWLNRATTACLYSCTDIFEGYRPEDDIPF